jgi:SLT domain-containing protein
MVPIIASPMSGNVGSVNGAASAASSAWSTMQSIISRPLQAFVNITRTITEVVKNVAGHADGGFVTTEQLSWLAENNEPEVVIPLSAGKRTRAMDLYKKTGAILGYSGNTAFSSSYGSGSTTNVGGLTVNVYGTEGQDVEELADIVIDKIQNVLEVK